MFRRHTLYLFLFCFGLLENMINWGRWLFLSKNEPLVCVFGYSFGNKRRTHQPLRGGGGGSVCGRVPSSGVSTEFFFLSSLWCIIRIDVEMEPTRNICQTGWKHLTDTSDPCGSIPHVNDPPFFYSMAPEENKTKNRKKKKEQSGIPFYLFNEIKWKSECFASVASMFKKKKI